ncbi:hypothetical protein HDA40_007456 [Hamadaea flava]|nr:hypothetical protein [Hamadaea flava]
MRPAAVRPAAALPPLFGLPDRIDAQNSHCALFN